MALETTIENMVSAISLGIKIDLKYLASNLKGLEYNPENFPGAVYRIHEPKVAMLIFSTGKVICTGARKEEDITKAVGILRTKLAETDINVDKEPTIEVQNIVASSSLGFKINLDTIATECLNTEYEPEQFPGLVFRLDHPKTVILIFRSGKMIITGAKTATDVKLAAENTREEVMQYDAVIE